MPGSATTVRDKGLGESSEEKSYHGKPVGNSHEYMPLDCHLNQDIHACHHYHTQLTQHIPDENSLKFTSPTPKRMADSYIRLTHPDTGVVPSSDRIILR